MNRFELKCASPTHAENKGLSGWDDGVLAVVENARRVPSFFCSACAERTHAADAVTDAARRSKEDVIAERLANLEAEMIALKGASKEPV